MKSIFFAISLVAASMNASAIRYSSPRPQPIVTPHIENPDASTTVFDGNKMNLVYAANLKDSTIQLVANGDSGGAAWLTSKVSTTTSLDVNFTFSLQSNGSSPMADGIAFALQNIGTNALGNLGSSVGYTGLNGVGSVIQTYTSNAAGLNITGNAYDTKKAPVSLGYATNVIGNENVQYDVSTNMLSMTGDLVVDGTTYHISDSKKVDLESIFGSTMTMGFTGATGSNHADERITSFSVTFVPEPETYAMLLAGLGVLGVAARRRKSL